MRLPSACLSLVLLAGASGWLAADEPVDYSRQIKPLLEQKCFACHGSLKQEGGLRLDTAAAIRRGGDSGPAAVADQPDASPLLERVSAGDESVRMPREATPLSIDEIGLLRRWISAGAAGPADEQPEPDPRQHWAFVAPRRPQMPPIREAAARPIDHFLSEQLTRRNLVPVGAAPPEVQLRRVYLDLIGMPPAREELAAHLADERPDAYERVVDRLLASPQHGERWARHWMDVWRYSDWYGRRSVPDVMNSYPQIWRWRDWIVRSLNADRGYDQMVQAMLAADELWPEDQDQAVATGFIVRNWFKWNYDTWMRDQVEHTGKAFLGLTFNCALCHDHKYDPISQEEYFRLRAIFEPLELRHERVPGQPDPGPFKKYVYAESYGPIASGLVRVFDEKLDAPTFMYDGGDQRSKLDRPPVPPGVPAFLDGERFAVQPIELPPTAYYPALRDFVQQEELTRRQAEVDAAQGALSASQAALSQATANARQATAFDETAAKTLSVAERGYEAAVARTAAALAELASQKARIAAAKARYGIAQGDAESLAMTAAAEERNARIAAANRELAAATLAVSQAEALAADDKRTAAIAAALQKRTAAEQALAAAQAAAGKPDNSYTPLGPIYPDKSTGRRAALARWITDRRNPLTARVAANHVWRWHFGRPLVETTANFGRNGKPPSHPELLDWLAMELVGSAGPAEPEGVGSLWPKETGHDGEPLSAKDSRPPDAIQQTGSAGPAEPAPPWTFKRLHRLLLTSDAYRRASEIRNPQSAIRNGSDPDNRWYWRANPARMEAEVVRDSVLSVAGQLDCTFGGPEIDHAQGLSSPRRSLYFAHHGEGKMELLEILDGASPTDCYERTTSIRPQQALALSNSELTRSAASKLASRLSQPGMADEGFIAAAFEQVLARGPTILEAAAATRFLADQSALYRESSIADPDQRCRASLVHVLLNHPDFVAVR